MAYKQISWIDAEGTEFALNKSNDIFLLNGLKGFTMPPVSFSEDEVPLIAGTRLKSIKFAAREMDVPFKIMCRDNISLINRVRQMLGIFNPLNADGKIRVTAIDGGVREINCRYIDGLNFDEGNGGDTWQVAIGVFRAFDPYWSDVTPVTQNFSTGSQVTFFPFPFRLSPSSILADFTVNNTGDVETLPVWTINGPCNSISITNSTTNEKIFLDIALNLTESIIIDTTKDKKTITKSDGTNVFGLLSDDSSLFPLQKGQNSIQVELANSSTDSSVTLSYRNKYLGAW
jgi:hypothetical protein